MNRTILGISLLALSLAACKSGGASAPTPAPTSVPTIASYTSADLTPEQLGSMTLALAEFDPKYATFAPVVDAPLMAILERAIDACNPDNESQALSKYEWVKGYSHQFGTAVRPDSGTLTVGTDIDVFSNASSAIGKLKYDRTALENDARGSYGCQGAKVERIDEFVVDSLGDESWGVRIRFSVEGIRGTTTAVVFRRDRVLATVSITRINSEDSSTEAVDAARKVDDKVMKVLTAPLT